MGSERILEEVLSILKRITPGEPFTAEDIVAQSASNGNGESRLIKGSVATLLGKMVTRNPEYIRRVFAGVYVVGVGATPPEPVEELRTVVTTRTMNRLKRFGRESGKSLGQVVEELAAMID